ncbi:MAG: transcriptional regulator, TetR family [Acidimicrobiales bacterium]|jgi:AcrR family transcriptional regulator|nr:transcriptional regulator, TetR family [Acidimicrobiales bacterium]
MCSHFAVADRMTELERPTASSLSRSQEARRQRVIQAAIELATEGGYDAVQMRDVATRARVAMGTIYRYFTSKDHLLSAAQVEWALTLQRRVTQRPRPEAPAADRVVEVLRRATRAMERQPLLSAAFVTAASSTDPAVSERQREVAAIVEATIGFALGDDDVGDTAGIIRVLGYVWQGALVVWLNGQNTAAQMSEELERAARLLLR